MTLPLPVQLAAAAIAFAALFAALREWRSERRLASFGVWGQPLLALAFWLLLFPPSLTRPADRLTVLTPGFTPAQQRALPWLDRVVALPGATASKTIATAPDLATALRLHPEARQLAIVGGGLPPRDQDVVAARALSFDAATARGLLALNAPMRVPLGAQWFLAGRAAAPTARVELRDPAGAVVDAVALAADGRFRLSAFARAAGPARFELRLLDAKQARVEAAAVPVVVEPGEGLTAILRAGAPDPEFKYWRRWAADAGIAASVAAALSEGVALRDGDAQLTPAALTMADFVILDERAWKGLAADEKAALLSAVREGLGLLLRITGPVDAAVAADWEVLGIKTLDEESAQAVTIDRRTGLRERASFNVAPVAFDRDGLQPLLEADDGEWLAAWREEGRGRIGVWRLVDSYRLILLGESARYGSLWQRTLAVLARAKPSAPEPQLPEASWVDERSVLCGLGEAASVVAPDGGSIVLLQDARGCAGYWPAQSGWQTLRTGAEALPLYVRAADDAPGLRAARDRAATLRLVHAQANEAAPATGKIRLPRWPFFLAWLLLTAALWWRERPS